MNETPLQDSRTVGLLSRIREDIGHLRQDVGNLARHRIAAGSSYAASRLRSFRASPPRQAFGVIGGAILIGALAAGIYAVCRSESCAARRRGLEADEE